jgi:hypothetical protein
MKHEKTVETIRKMYAGDGGARAFFDRAAERTNDVAETSIGIIGRMASVGKYEAIRLCRDLQSAGCGKLIVGRKGYGTRFRWEKSLPVLGKIAKGEDVELQDIAADIKADQEAGTDRPTAPTGLTIAEAKRMLAESHGVSLDKAEIIIRG